MAKKSKMVKAAKKSAKPAKKKVKPGDIIFGKGNLILFKSSPEIDIIIEAVYNSRYLKEDARARKQFTDKVIEYSEVSGADFSKVWPKFAIYVLTISKYSALASAKKNDYPRKSKIIAIIDKVAKLYKNKGSKREFDSVLKAAADATRWVERTEARFAAASAADAAEVAIGHAIGYTGQIDVQRAAELMVGAAAEAVGWAWESADRAAAAYKDYANYLLKLLHEASSKTKNPKRAKGKLTEIPSSVKIKRLPPGRAEGSELPLEYAGGLGDEKNKLHRSESPLAKGIGAWSMSVNLNKNPKNASAQISKCQKLWGSYCKNPTKKNLEAVKKNLEVMKNSKSKKVRAERARCLRAANRESLLR